MCNGLVMFQMEGGRLDIIADYSMMKTVRTIDFFSTELSQQYHLYTVQVTKTIDLRNNRIRRLHVQPTFPIFPVGFADTRYLYGYPRSKKTSAGILVTFPILLWLLIGLVTLSHVGVFAAARVLYNGPLKGEGLVNYKATTYDVILKVVSTLTEPEGVNIFTKWSTGD